MLKVVEVNEFSYFLSSIRNFKAFIVLLSFISSTYAVGFICDFHNEWWPTLETVYTCWDAQAKVSNNVTPLDSVKGTHMSGKGNAHVKALYVYKNAVLNYMPKRIESFFPNLLLIKLYGVQLTTITAEDLRPFPLLKVLSFDSNRLTSIDADLFKYTTRLSWINFDNNLIANVGQDVAAKLTALTYATFLNNRCINTRAETPQALQIVKLQLAVQCPPYKAPCDVRCTVNKEIDDLKKKATDQTQTNAGFEKKFADQVQINAAQSQTNTRLEKISADQGLVIAGLERKVAGQSQAIEVLDESIAELTRIISPFESRLVEVEKRVRECLAMP